MKLTFYTLLAAVAISICSSSYAKTAENRTEKREPRTKSMHKEKAEGELVKRESTLSILRRGFDETKHDGSRSKVISNFEKR